MSSPGSIPGDVGSIPLPVDQVRIRNAVGSIPLLDSWIWYWILDLVLDTGSGWSGQVRFHLRCLCGLGSNPGMLSQTLLGGRLSSRATTGEVLLPELSGESNLGAVQRCWV